jgi:iron-sulfur cluster repair protein YtfE (RIC family)
MDVLSHLIKEHREVESMLQKLADSDEGQGRKALVAELTGSLDTHMKVEERFVYPIVKDVVGGEDAQEAENEHQLAREGLQKLSELVSEPGFGAAVDMVKAGIKHHVTDEEDEVFPELRKKASDRIDALGDPDELEAQVSSGDAGSASKQDLYEEAKEADIPGRSSMSKDELAKALNK